MERIMKGAEPWASEGDETGVVVLHGFTGSPQGVRPWAEGIARTGRTVVVPRLPGHGTTEAELARTTWRDWVAEAETAFRGIGERCSPVFVFGLSMGGAIALDLAARFADTIRGIAIVNAAVVTTDPRAKLAPILKRLPLRVKGVGSDIAQPGVEELAYRRIPTQAAGQFLEYQGVVRSRLPKVTAPALIFVSPQDHVVSPANADLIAERIGSAEKEVVRLERSYHVATLDYDLDRIVEHSAAFIARHIAST